MKRIIALTILTLITIIAAACTFNFSSARIADAKMTKGVSDKMEAIDPTNTFETTDVVVHCLVILSHAPENTKVKAIWSVIKAEGQTPNDKFGQKEIEGGGEKNAIDFNYTPPPSGLPVGEYKVDIYLNPQPGKEEPPAQSVPFSVKAARPLITDVTLSANDSGDPVTEFPAGTTILYCTARLRGAAPGTKVTASWIAVETKGTSPNFEIRRFPVLLDAGQDKVRYNLRLASGFPPGLYRVDLYMGDSTTADKSVTLTVAEGGCWISHSTTRVRTRVVIRFQQHSTVYFTRANFPTSVNICCLSDLRSEISSTGAVKLDLALDSRH